MVYHSQLYSCLFLLKSNFHNGRTKQRDTYFFLYCIQRLITKEQLVIRQLIQVFGYFIRDNRLYFKNMHSIECTPSVNFHLEDQRSHFYIHVQLPGQEIALFQLSNTNNKNVGMPETGVKVSQLDIDKQEILETTPTVLHINSQDFFQEFSSKFTVKFQQSQIMGSKKRLDQRRQQIENEQVHEVRNQNSIQDFKDVRLSFPTEKNKENYFGISINNQKGLKSQIVSFKKKGCFAKQRFKRNQIKQVSQFQLLSALRLDKQTIKLPQIYQPKSCRNISNRLYFVSKATPKDSQCAKKALQKYSESFFKKREKISIFPELVNKSKCRANNDIKNSKQSKQMKKQTIFSKLPSLR